LADFGFAFEFRPVLAVEVHEDLSFPRGSSFDFRSRWRSLRDFEGETEIRQIFAPEDFPQHQDFAQHLEVLRTKAS